MNLFLHVPIEYKKFTQRSGHSAQSFDKDVVFKVNVIEAVNSVQFQHISVHRPAGLPKPG